MSTRIAVLAAALIGCEEGDEPAVDDTAAPTAFPDSVRVSDDTALPTLETAQPVAPTGDTAAPPEAVDRYPITERWGRVTVTRSRQRFLAGSTQVDRTEGAISVGFHTPASVLATLPDPIDTEGPCKLYDADQAGEARVLDGGAVVIDGLTAGSLTYAPSISPVTSRLLYAAASDSPSILTFDLWEPGDPVSAAIAGTDEVPAMTLTTTAPSGPGLTEPADLFALSGVPEGDVVFAWERGVGELVDVRLITSRTSAPYDTRSILCRVDAAGGGFTVPGRLVDQLLANAQQMTWVVWRIAVDRVRVDGRDFDLEVSHYWANRYPVP